MKPLAQIRTGRCCCSDAVLAACVIAGWVHIFKPFLMFQPWVKDKGGSCQRWEGDIWAFPLQKGENLGATTF